MENKLNDKKENNKDRGSKEKIIILSVFFFLLLVFISMLFIIPKNNYKYISGISENKSYKQTSEFQKLYMQKIEYLKNYVLDYIYNPESIPIYKSNLNVEGNAFKYLCVITKNDGSDPIYLTNIMYIDKAGFMDTISQNFVYYTLDNKYYDTNVDNMGKIEYNNIKGYSYKIYTKIDEQGFADDIGIYIKNYNKTVSEFKILEVVLPITFILILILFIYITVSYMYKDKNINKNTVINSMPLEILLTISIGIIYFLIYCVIGKSNIYIDLFKDSLIAKICFIFIAALVMYKTYKSIVERIKLKTIFKNTLVYILTVKISEILSNFKLVWIYILISLVQVGVNIIFGYLFVYYVKVIHTVNVFYLLMIIVTNLIYLIYMAYEIIQYKKRTDLLKQYQQNLINKN